jgi:hypothetical protein
VTSVLSGIDHSSAINSSIEFGQGIELRIVLEHGIRTRIHA